VKDRNFPSAARSLRSAAILFFSCLGLAIALAHPPDAQASSAAHPLDGMWVNADSAAQSLTMVEVTGNRLQLFGQCHPQPCEWGVVKARSFTAGVKLGAVAALQAKINLHFAVREIIATLEPDGRMRVEIFTHFTDQSGRNDYRVVDYFVRGRQSATH